MASAIRRVPRNSFTITLSLRPCFSIIAIIGSYAASALASMHITARPPTRPRASSSLGTAGSGGTNQPGPSCGASIPTAAIVA